jgi:response regulator RpfG family c-di-GMP phosphodiesterase
MPGLNGVDFVRMVRRSSSAMQFMPMIMLTGHSDVRRLNEARDCGINEFLGKPVTASAILSRLEAVILKPRPFVRSSTFFGPDRRRRKGGAYRGPLRRSSDQAAFV